MKRRTEFGRLGVLSAALTTAFLVSILGSSTALALAQTPWIHIEVTDDESDEASGEESGRTHVKVNLPLSVVRVAIEAAPEKVLSKGRVHIHDSDIEIADLRRIWQELRAAGDAELVTVEEADETVVVRREGDRIRIDVDKRAEEDVGEVQIDLPVSLVDALLSSEGESLNLAAAIDELSDQRGEIVRVRDGESSVRIWIDEK
jgi:glycine/D-amino acid oxidase-like deaminating enzyme